MPTAQEIDLVSEKIVLLGRSKKVNDSAALTCLNWFSLASVTEPFKNADIGLLIHIHIFHAQEFLENPY
jgi:hypothetical protein